MRTCLGKSVPFSDLIMLAYHYTISGSDNSVPSVLLITAKAILNPISFRFNVSVYENALYSAKWILAFSRLTSILSLLTPNAKIIIKITMVVNDPADV